MISMMSWVQELIHALLQYLYEPVRICIMPLLLRYRLLTGYDLLTGCNLLSRHNRLICYKLLGNKAFPL